MSKLSISISDPGVRDDICSLIDRALKEDLGSGDVTTLATVPLNDQAIGTFLAKADGVIAGLAVAEMVFQKVDPAVRVHWTAKDGDFVRTGTRFGHATGSTRSLLIAERLCLNVLQRMGGVATATRLMVLAARPFRAKILDTRKTAPGMRLLDKLAVVMGGGCNHRIGLYDMVLVKDNHVEAAGGIVPAINAVDTYLQQQGLRGHVPVEIECRTLEEVKEVLSLGRTCVDRIMLDNMVKLQPSAPSVSASLTAPANSAVLVDTSMLRSALALINGRYQTEASGNVTLETVGEIAATGVDFISSGSLTHSVIAMDISMKITRAPIVSRL